MINSRGSIGGVTVGDQWKHNNPDLRYDSQDVSDLERELFPAHRLIPFN